MRTLFSIVLLLISFTAIGANGLSVGVWKSNITPDIEEMNGTCLAGYGGPFSRCNSQVVLDEISIRSLSLSDNDSTNIFLVFDAIGVGDDMVEQIKEKAAHFSSGYIKKSDIKVISTHTHSGPDLQGLWGGVNQNYKKRVISTAAFNAVMSYLIRYPVDTYSTSATVPVENRRGWGLVDDKANILEFKIVGTNIPVASIVNMSAHPTILTADNQGYSAGYIHTLRDKIERKRGGLSVFINGILGDSQPSGIENYTYAGSKKYGKDVADIILRTMNNMKKVNTNNLNTNEIKFTHEVTNQNILAAKSLGFLDINLSNENKVSAEIELINIGGVISIIGFPGEALSRTGVPMKKKLNSETNLFFGLYQSSYGYFIPSDEYLKIDGRTTEENASLDKYIGDHSVDVFEKLL